MGDEIAAFLLAGAAIFGTLTVAGAIDEMVQRIRQGRVRR